MHDLETLKNTLTPQKVLTNKSRCIKKVVQYLKIYFFPTMDINTKKLVFEGFPKRFCIYLCTGILFKRIFLLRIEECFVKVETEMF